MDNDDIRSVDLDALRMVVNASPVIGAYAVLVSTAASLHQRGMLVTDPAEPDWLAPDFDDLPDDAPGSDDPEAGPAERWPHLIGETIEVVGTGDRGVYRGSDRYGVRLDVPGFARQRAAIPWSLIARLREVL